MLMIRFAILLLSVILMPACQARQPGWNEVDRQVRRMLITHPFMLDGASIYVGRPDGSVIYEKHYGEYDETTRVPLASASKLVSAVAVMRLVESGDLDPEAPVSTYLPEFASEKVGHEKSEITIEQMYSMTSGFPGSGVRSKALRDRSITLEEAVEHIACCVDLASEPGTVFTYTGYGMHVAGRVCEVLSGQAYDEFFDTQINEPLGTNFTWDGLGETTNFRPAGGGAASLADYTKLLTLVASRGETQDVRLLTPESTDWMMTERTIDLKAGSLPRDAERARAGYAFGMWVEQRDEQGQPTVVSSPGAFGFTPWIDLEDDYVGIIMVKGVRQRLLSDIDSIREAIDQAVNFEAGTDR